MTSTRNDSFSLEQLVALNDEIQAMVEANMPLERGLCELARDGHGVLSGFSDTLAQRLQQGESLTDAVAKESRSFPSVYRVVIEAGLRAGRLPAALEGISEFAGRLLELRRRIGLAFVYPIIVIFVAYMLFLLFVTHLIERFVSAYATFRLPVPKFLEVLSAIGQLAWAWWWVLPLCLLIVIAWWCTTRRSSLLMLAATSRPLRWLPGIKGILRNYTYAGFSHLLALMTEHGVGLPQGIVLAADATGDANFQRAAKKLAAAIEAGENYESAEVSNRFPPTLLWIMSRGEQLGRLPQALLSASRTYHKQAITRAEWFNSLFPVITGVGIGGVVTLTYVLTVFVPFTEFLKALALE